MYLLSSSWSKYFRFLLAHNAPNAQQIFDVPNLKQMLPTRKQYYIPHSKKRPQPKQRLNDPKLNKVNCSQSEKLDVSFQPGGCKLLGYTVQILDNFENSMFAKPTYPDYDNF